MMNDNDKTFVAHMFSHWVIPSVKDSGHGYTSPVVAINIDISDYGYFKRLTDLIGGSLYRKGIERLLWKNGSKGTFLRVMHEVSPYMTFRPPWLIRLWELFQAGAVTMDQHEIDTTNEGIKKEWEHYYNQVEDRHAIYEEHGRLTLLGIDPPDDGFVYETMVVEVVVKETIPEPEEYCEKCGKSEADNGRRLDHTSDGKVLCKSCAYYRHRKKVDRARKLEQLMQEQRAANRRQHMD